MARIKHYNSTTQRWEYSDKSVGIKGETGANGADGLTTSVNGIEQVNGEITLTAADVGADPSGTASSTVSNHNTDANAHSSLFANKADKLKEASYSGAVTVAMADNTEYSCTAVTSLTMTGNTSTAHGFVTFAASTPTIFVTGFTASGGDDVAEASASETWEFNTKNGYILWKNWSA